MYLLVVQYPLKLGISIIDAKAYKLLWFLCILIRSSNH